MTTRQKVVAILKTGGFSKIANFYRMPGHAIAPDGSAFYLLTSKTTHAGSHAQDVFIDSVSKLLNSKGVEHRIEFGRGSHKEIVLIISNPARS